MSNIKYEVMKDYPNSHFVVGQIIELKKTASRGYVYEWCDYDGINFEYQSFFDEFPEIFQKLLI